MTNKTTVPTRSPGGCNLVPCTACGSAVGQDCVSLTPSTTLRHAHRDRFEDQLAWVLSHTPAEVQAAMARIGYHR